MKNLTHKLIEKFCQFSFESSSLYIEPLQLFIQEDLLSKGHIEEFENEGKKYPR